MAFCAQMRRFETEIGGAAETRSAERKAKAGEERARKAGGEVAPRGNRGSFGARESARNWTSPQLQGGKSGYRKKLEVY